MAKGAGGRAPGGGLPASLWRGLIRVARGLDRLRPMQRVTPQSLTALGARWAFTSRARREELGWRPRPWSDVLDRALTALDARMKTQSPAERQASSAR